MKNFLLGMFAAVDAVLLAAAAVIWLGAYDVAANVPHWEITRVVLEAARDRSVAAHSKAVKLPSLDDPALIEVGALEFDKTCRVCHGGPGRKREGFAKGLYPHPPGLSSGDVQDEMSAEEIYWIVKNGLKMTGMPAFSASDEERDILGAVAFVKRLKDMQPDDYNGLLEKAGRGAKKGGATGS